MTQPLITTWSSSSKRIVAFLDVFIDKLVGISKESTEPNKKVLRFIMFMARLVIGGWQCGRSGSKRFLSTEQLRLATCFILGLAIVLSGQ